MSSADWGGGWRFPCACAVGSRGPMSLRTLLALLVLVIGPKEVLAWGATGHEWVSGIAIEKLPDSVPAFVRTPEAAAEIAALGRELDRSKGAAEMHDKERDPGYYVDLTDDGGGTKEVSAEKPAAEK